MKTNDTDGVNSELKNIMDDLMAISERYAHVLAGLSKSDGCDHEDLFDEFTDGLGQMFGSMGKAAACDFIRKALNA